MYYVAPVSKIEKYADDTERIQRQGQYFKDNAPNETADDWLNQLRLAFNAGWEIRDNVLIFERKDFFFQGNNLPINPNNIIKLCFKFKDKPQPQFSILSYQLDGIETCGGEALRRYYWRLQDYDPNNLNPNLRGKAKYPIPFAPTRFRNDGIDTDVLNIFNSIPLVELLFPDEFERALILPDNLSFVPKLLIHKVDTGFDNAEVLWEESTTTAGVIDYNLDFWLDPPYSNNHTNDYYDRFFKIDEPSVTNQLNREFEMELNYDCEFLQLISLNKTIEIDTGVTGIKIAKINTITIGKTLILRGDL
jgi:hypothetical protein